MLKVQWTVGKSSCHSHPFLATPFILGHGPPVHKSPFHSSLAQSIPLVSLTFPSQTCLLPLPLVRNCLTLSPRGGPPEPGATAPEFRASVAAAADAPSDPEPPVMLPPDAVPLRTDSAEPQAPSLGPECASLPSWCSQSAETSTGVKDGHKYVPK